DEEPDGGGGSAEIRSRDDIKKELSNMSFEDILKLQNKVGTRVFNEVAYGSEQPEGSQRKTRTKRLNKNRPAEVSTRRPAPFLRQVVPVRTATFRDPRFDDLSGQYKREIFEKTYKFIEDIKHREKEVKGRGTCPNYGPEAAEEDEEPGRTRRRLAVSGLTAGVGPENGGCNRERMQRARRTLPNCYRRHEGRQNRAFTQVPGPRGRTAQPVCVCVCLQENQERAKKSRDQQRERELQFRKQQRERAEQGARPFFLKKSEKKKLQLAEKFQQLKKSGKLENFLSKKRKRNATKDRRKLPE
ncbi:unnamed protein product, partial [Tetraodon nigroviridis]